MMIVKPRRQTRAQARRRRRLQQHAEAVQSAPQSEQQSVYDTDNKDNTALEWGFGNAIFNEKITRPVHTIKARIALVLESNARRHVSAVLYVNEEAMESVSDDLHAEAGTRAYATMELEKIIGALPGDRVEIRTYARMPTPTFRECLLDSTRLQYKLHVEFDN